MAMDAMWTNQGDDIYVNADRSAVVPGDSTDAAYLLVAKGGQISTEEAQKYGLVGSQQPALDQGKAKDAQPAPEQGKAKDERGGLKIKRDEPENKGQG